MVNLGNHLKIMTKKIVFVFCLMFVVCNTWATHIVGGELVYKCLGGFTYEIRLKVYRDCYNGNPNAPFDDPARINVFDVNGNRVDTFFITRPPFDTLPINLADPCFVIPPDVCVEAIEYIDTIQLPYSEGGYTLAYHRCCRNMTILNIVEPLDAGATYSCFIPMRNNQTECDNSNPYFNNLPPIGICVNKPLIFDHSATDIDGDSLVYEVCTPFIGATPLDPLENDYAFFPPFPNVTWQTPYGLNDMLSGVPLQINPRTGLLTATPGRVGQFVVGICVKEYRNGILLSEGRRDFQFNVQPCGRIVLSSFFAPEYLCSTYSALFNNQSAGNITNYNWDFGDPTTTNDFSSALSPSYTYPDTGTYRIRLAVSNATGCADTSYHDITIVRNEITADINMNNRFCADRGTLIDVLDISTVGNRNPINSWSWYIDNLLQNDMDNALQIPIVGDDTMNIKLVVRNDENCIDSIIKPIMFSMNPDKINIPDNQLCRGDSFIVNNPSNPLYAYRWQPNLYISNSQISNPIIRPLNTVQYILTTTNIANTCFIQDTIDVTVNPYPLFSVMNDTALCTNVVQLVAQSDGDTHIWSNSPSFTIMLNASTSNTNTTTIQNNREGIYYFKTFIGNCSDTGSVRVQVNAMRLRPQNVSMCRESQPKLILANAVFDANNSYQWYRNNILIEGITSDSIWVPAIPATYTVIGRNNYGCRDTARAQVNVFSTAPIEAYADKYQIYAGERVQLHVTQSQYYSYLWSPNRNIEQNSLPNPIVFPDETTTYTVQVRDVNSCIKYDSVRIEIIENPCALSNIFIPNAFTPNGDSKHDIFKIYGDGIEKIQLFIYNRYGEKVFESNDQKQGWNGEYKGRLQAPDVFGYVVEIACFGGETLTKKGNITLLR